MRAQMTAKQDYLAFFVIFSARTRHLTMLATVDSAVILLPAI